MGNHRLRVRPDKVGSVCAPFGLPPYLSVSPEPMAAEGVAVVARVLNVSAKYGHIELPSGRPALLVPGDLIVGVLGGRAALRGFCGRTPTNVTQGDILWLLNKGGVIGESEGGTVGLGDPVRLEIVGSPEREGRLLRLADYGAPRVSRLPEGLPPVLVVAATCMHAGKTTAAGVVIHHLSSAGLRVHAGKATGVAALADLLTYADNGALRTMSFVDVGLPSTCYHDDIPEVTRTLIAHLATEQPEVIVLELGDGLLGSYGVDQLLDDTELTGCFSGALVAANDIIGGWAAAERLRARGVEIAAITGPATDNQSGRDRLGELGYPAANIFQQPAEVCRLAREAIGLSAAS